MDKYWIFDEDGWYTEECVEAEEAPDNGFPFEPPEVSPGYWPKFNGVGWVVTDDYRLETLEECKLRALGYLNNAVYVPLGNYPEVEIATFSLQYAEAKHFVNTGESSYTLDALAAAQGVEVEDLALTIIEKNEADTKANIDFVAKVQRLRKRIERAESKKEVPSEEDIIEHLKP